MPDLSIPIHPNARICCPQVYADDIIFLLALGEQEESGGNKRTYPSAIHSCHREQGSKFAQIRFLESQTDHKVEDLIAPHFPGVAGGEIHHGGAEWCDITGFAFVETFPGLIPDALLCMHRSVFATK
jgi:hypothetical protein